MKRRFAVVLAALAWSHAPTTELALAQEVPPPSAEPGGRGPVTVAVGCFINEIYAINLPDQSFQFNMYLWFRWDPKQWPPPPLEDPSLDATSRGAVPPNSDQAPLEATGGPFETFEIIRSRGIESKEVYRRDGYCALQVSGTVGNQWSVDDFPFDHQKFVLQVEDTSYETNQLIYVADVEFSGLAPSLDISGSRIRGLSTTVEPFVYPTNFGDPALVRTTQSAYSRFYAVVATDRLGWQLFVKLFSGLFVATAIAMLAFFIDATQVDPRFGVCVGGLFGIIASSYVVTSLLPEGVGLAYADRLHIASLVAVLAALLVSTVSLSLKLRGDDASDASSKRLDRVSFAVIVPAYLLVVLGLTMQALR